MRRTVTGIVLLVVACGPAVAAGQLPAVKGKSYSAARALLMSKGYRPDDWPQGQFAKCAPGREALCNAYPETRICRGTGRASCEFVFDGPMRSDGGYIPSFLVETVGEDDDPRVTGIKQLSEGELEALYDE